MRIAILCNNIALGGLELNTLKLSKWLAARKHTIYFLAPFGKPIYQFAEKDEGVALWGGNSENKEDKVFLYPFESKTQYFNIRRARQLAKFLKKQKIEVLLTAHSKDLNMVAIAKAFFYPSLKVIYQQQMWIGVNKKDWLHTLYYKQIDRWVSPLHVVADNVFDKTKYPAEKVEVIPLCIKTEKFANIRTKKSEARNLLEVPEDMFIVGNVGRLAKGKNQIDLIEAIKILRDEGIILGALLVGEETRGEEGKYLPRLQELIQDYQLEAQVFIRPFRKEVQMVFACLDIFVLTSLAETFGMVTVEAMSSGLPLIGTNKGGTSELIEPEINGLLYTPKDPQTLAKLIRELYENPEKAQRFSENGARIAREKYDYTVQVRQTEKLMEKLIRREN